MATCSACVGVLLGTYRGEKYLAEQFASLEAQTHENWKIWISDDGSDDGTIALVERYRAKWGADRLTLLAGPRQGFGSNYLFLASHPEVSADYYAYCDQDDIWHPEKLARAVAWLEQQSPDAPALYCSRTQLVDENDVPIGPTTLYSRPPSFENALVQNIASGNTMTFNNALRGMLRRVGHTADGMYHDWLTYLVATACDGAVHYDTFLSVRYRQHGANVLGENLSFHARLRRAKLMMQGRLHTWVDLNVAAIRELRPQMSAKALRTFDAFCAARGRSLIPRLVGTYLSGVQRQTVLGNCGLTLAVILNKL